MSRQCLALVGGLVLALACRPALAEKSGDVDPAKLLGTWTMTKTDDKEGPPPEAVITVEFLKDGKMNATYTLKDKTMKATGGYTLKGDKLTTTLDYGGKGKEKTENLTVKTLTDSKFVVTEEKDGKTLTTEFKK